MNFDIKKLLTMQGETPEEFERIRRGILALGNVRRKDDMNVADRELCRELFVLSGWGQAETHLTYYDGELGETQPWDRSTDNRKAIPAYDLGYLLRKLGNHHIELKRPYSDSEPVNLWSCMAMYDDGEVLPAYLIEGATAPEDAVAKLATSLFKRGALKRE